MQQIESILNNLSASEILEILKENNTQAFFVGSSDLNDEVLENSLKNPNISLEEIKAHAFITTEVRRAYFDENNCLAFEINLDYDIASENTIYALCITSSESVFVVALTPKIKKLKGIGGTFILKTSMEGKSGEMIFKSDNYISEAEFEPFRNFVSNFESLLTDFKYEAKLKMLLLDLENYLDNEIAFHKAELERRKNIGKKDYFYRNTLPPDYVEMGQMLKRDDYPLLWYYTLGLEGNNGGEFFTLPKAGLYTKGTDRISEVGVFGISGLPDLQGSIPADDTVWKDANGVFYKISYYADDWIDRAGGNGAWLGFSASRYSAIYGRASDVEVNRIHCLEGIYAGRNLSMSPPPFIQELVDKFIKEDTKQTGAIKWEKNKI